MTSITSPAQKGRSPGQGDDGRPLRRDAQRNRERILQAAAEVFTERGLDATLDDVAHHAGVGVGTVYRRFPNKEALAEALYERRVDALAVLAERALAARDSWVGLVSFVEQAAASLAADRGLWQIVMYASYGRDRCAYARERILPLTTKLVQRAQQDGAVRADLSPTDIPAIEFMVGAAAEYARHIRPELWRRYLALILDSLRPSREDTTELPERALSPDEITQLMGSGAAAARIPGLARPHR
jgi:AcrR family transcriptional regulator